MRLIDVLDEPLLAGRLAGNTRRNYIGALGRWSQSGVVTVADVTIEAVRAYLTARIAVVSPASANQELMAVLSVLAHLETTGRYDLAQLQAIRRLKVQAEGARALSAPHLTPYEFDRLLSYALTKPWHYVNGRDAGKPILICSPLEARTVGQIGAWAGLRQQEMARLAWSDIDWQSRTLRVGHEHGVTKTKRERRVPMCSQLVALLEELREARLRGSLGTFVLGPTARSRSQEDRPLTARCISTRLLALREVACMPQVTFHLLRHTRASWWVQAGVPIAKVAAWLGHSVETCVKFYAGIRAEYDADVERMPA